jgi:hypothetical protein
LAVNRRNYSMSGSYMIWSLKNCSGKMKSESLNCGFWVAWISLLES